jgi:hypothetical protein
MTEPSDDAARVLLEPEAVREWADRHGATPVPGASADRDVPVGLLLDGDAAGDAHLDWDAFVGTLADAGLALRVDGADHEFVDRERVTGTGDEPEGAREARQAARRRDRERRRSTVEDPDAERREDEAADQENLDSHRDEEPFRS